jgi:hypothetical protein
VGRGKKRPGKMLPIPLHICIKKWVELNKKRAVLQHAFLLAPVQDIIDSKEI